MVCNPFEANPKNHVADFHRLAGNDSFALDRSDDESRQIVFAVSIESRHLGGLAADQGTAIVLAGFGQAFYNFFRDFRLELAGREIVHEETAAWRLVPRCH